jgi:hypothetical protein
MKQHGTIGRILFATLMLMLAATRAGATIDLSGDYVGINVPCRFIFAQTGTTLQLTGSCSIVTSGPNPISPPAAP